MTLINESAPVFELKSQNDTTVKCYVILYDIYILYICYYLSYDENQK